MLFFREREELLMPAGLREDFPVANLKPGMRTDCNLYSGDMLLLNSGVELTAAIISSFQRRGIAHVQISQDSWMAKSHASKVEPDAVLQLIGSAGQVYQQHGLELAIPQEALEEATDELEGYFTEIEFGTEPDLDQARGLIKNLVSMFSARANLAIKLLDLDNVDRYTYRHSLNVGLLFMAVAKKWVKSEEEMQELVFGAVLHDLGKAKVGAEIINSPRRLTPEEWDIMRQHPVWSAEMMERAGADETTIGIARWHHEKVDGSGYPDGKDATALNRFVQLSQVCDVYDALTTKRSYKQKMYFSQAIDIILRSSGTAFVPEVAHVFIRAIGRFPVGSFVYLNTGEVAVVVRTNEQFINRPVVSRVLDTEMGEISEGEELDLAENKDVYITGTVVSQESSLE
jgi:putative nucleotidyltransferase with HDIG domain